MIKKTTYRLLFTAFLVFVVGCESREISLDDAERIALKEMSKTAVTDAINVEQMKKISVIENSEIDGWEIYFENSDKSYRLNVLVSKDGNVEVHRMR